MSLICARRSKRSWLSLRWSRSGVSIERYWVKGNLHKVILLARLNIKENTRHSCKIIRLMVGCIYNNNMFEFRWKTIYNCVDLHCIRYRMICTSEAVTEELTSSKVLSHRYITFSLRLKRSQNRHQMSSGCKRKQLMKHIPNLIWWETLHNIKKQRRWYRC